MNVGPTEARPSEETDGHHLGGRRAVGACRAVLKAYDHQIGPVRQVELRFGIDSQTIRNSIDRVEEADHLDEVQEIAIGQALGTEGGEIGFGHLCGR